MDGRWMSAADAASALGVRPATLYSYVSRGVITREVVRDETGRRRSRFDRREVLALAVARRPARAGRAGDLIESDITQLDPAGALTFRGIDVAGLAQEGFEHTARVLLEAPDLPWPSVDIGCETSLPDLDRIRVALVRAAAADPRRGDVDTAYCRAVGLAAIETAGVAVTGLGDGSVAERLAAHWGAPAAVGALDVTLAVLADHELTASTLATRAAAGVRADPWMAILAGHAALGGTRQGAASVRVVDLLTTWRDGLPDPLPGFGHAVYQGPDPRALVVLDAVRAIDPAVVDEAEALAVAVARARSLHPNIDLGLAALITAAGLPADAGSVLYGIARIAGLAAHAIEEYPHDLRLRPRAVVALPDSC